MREMLRKHPLAAGLILVTALAFALRAWGIGAQPPTSDDVEVAYTAVNYVEHGQPGPIMPFHPNLRNLLVYLSMGVFDAGVLGLKGWSLLLGTLSVPLVGLIAYRLSRNTTAALVAATLLAVEILAIDYSRQAIQEAHTTFFFLLGTWLVLEVLVRDDRRAWAVALPLAGIGFGLGAASKAHALPPLAVSIALLLWVAWRQREPEKLARVVTWLVVVPFAVYLATYVPWFLAGHDAGEWFEYQRDTAVAAATHVRQDAIATLAQDEPAQWFVRPLMGAADYSELDEDSVFLLALSNPVMWLAVLPAAAYSLLRRRHRRAHQVAQAYFWTAYVPLALSPRPIWLLSALAVLPFAYVLIGLVAGRLWRLGKRRVVAGYVALAVVSSLAMYPLVIGHALDVGYLRPLIDMTGIPL